jgi:hypothetical protein
MKTKNIEELNLIASRTKIVLKVLLLIVTVTYMIVCINI